MPAPNVRVKFQPRLPSPVTAAAAASAAAAATNATNAAGSATNAASSASSANTSATNAASTAAALSTAQSQIEAALVGVNARTFWVDSTRPDNSGVGTSEATAKQTVAAAVALLQEGDVLFIKRGGPRYRAENLILPAHTHVIAYGGGERAILDFSKQVANNSFSTVSGAANVFKITVNFATLFPATHPSGISALFTQVFPTIFEGSPEDDPKGLYSGGKRMRCVNGTLNFIFAWQNVGFTKAAGIAAVQAEPGSFFIMKGDDTTVAADSSGTTFDFYVHPPGSTNPITNGKEYAVASGREDGFWQRQGGSCSGVWFARTAHKNAFQFDGVHCKDLKFSHYPMHGCFHNSCVVEDSESYALPRGGACFHGYRDLSVAPDRGLIYRRCKTEGGAWSVYSHSAGGAIAQLSALIEDHEARDCVHPISPNSVQGHIVRRSKFFGVRTVLSSGGGLYEDCIWNIHALDQDTDIPTFGAGGTLRNCVVFGGRPFRRVMQNLSTATPITVENSTLLLLDDGYQDNTGNFVTATNSVWTLGLIAQATNSYTGAVLNHLGSNGSTTGHHSAIREVTLARTPSGDMTSAVVRVWPKDLTTYVIPDRGFDLINADNKATLYATNSADKALIVPGTPVRLYHNGDRVREAGIYWVTAVSNDAAPRLTLDRPIAWPVPLAAGPQYQKDAEGVVEGGSYYNFAPVPRLELRLPQAVQFPARFLLTLSGGTTVAPDSNGLFPQITLSGGGTSFDHLMSLDGYKASVNVDPVVSGENSGAATMRVRVSVEGLKPTYTRGPYGIPRIDGYLADAGVGSTL